jgi:hypothetical protein
VVAKDISVCPKCGGGLKYYDKVKRIVRAKGRIFKYVYIRRLRCSDCGVTHREIPRNIFPFKHYEAEIIKGVLEGLITSETLGFEDYPCETTMIRWRASRNLQVIL